MVGNLTSRAIVDARDLVRGLWLSAKHCVPGDVYNLGGDRIYSIEQVIETIRACIKRDFAIEQNPALMRGCDEPVIAGDITKFRRCTGWTTEIELARTVRDMLDWWRDRLSSASKSDRFVIDSLPSELPA
jgi:nucleoside-diphosphate-sugar epimerase